MDFRSEHYFQASLERMRQARSIYRTEDSYALAMYVAGVAVECMLRAFMLRKKKEFESRHDLLLLFKESGMLDVDPERLKARGLSDELVEAHTVVLQSSVNEVFVLWHNNYRYASEARVTAHLKRAGHYRGIRGEVLKARAFQLLNAAGLFVEKGSVQWH